MKKILEVIDEMIELNEAVSNATQVFAAIEKYLIKLAPEHKANLIKLMDRRMPKEDKFTLVMNWAKGMEAGSFFKPGVKIKDFKNDMTKALRKVK